MLLDGVTVRRRLQYLFWGWRPLGKMVCTASAVRLRQASGETTMTFYTGIDIPPEVSHFCIADAAGNIVKEAHVASEPEPIIA